MLKALQFHSITKNFKFGGTWNYPAQLENFIKTIHKLGYEIVLPDMKKEGVVLVFDDGEENLYHYAFPILKKYRCPAIIFLIVGYIGKKNLWDISLFSRHHHLNWRQIMEMKENGIAFGSHTMSHPDLTKLSAANLEYELSESKRILEKYLGPIDFISYPFNRVNQRVIKKVREIGYKFGFGGKGEDNLTIKKEGVYITDNARSLKIKITEKPRSFYHYARIQQKVINLFSIATLLNRRKAK
ncbi:MAG: polysaccharide deacetylase family protein [candidate division WOR-3 bacterium]